MPQYNFTAEEAVSILGIRLAPGRMGKLDYKGNVFTSCIACASHDAGHLNVRSGMFHCFSCGFKSRDVFVNLPETAGRVTENAPVKEVEEEAEASESTKHKCYCALLSDQMFSLNKNTVEYLKKRGMTEETARKYGFRTYPALDPLKDFDRRKSVANRIMEKGISTKGVAAFATDKSGKRYLCHKNGEGLIMPIISINHKAVGLRHRPLVKKDGVKETPFSTSGKPGGVSAHSPAGFFCNWENNRPKDDSDGEYVFQNQRYPRKHAFCVTEGPLKAALLRQEMPESGPVISISGVSSIRNLEGILKEMKKMGYLYCDNYLDMDEFIPFLDQKTGKMLEGNPGVARASNQLKRMCAKIGLKCFRRKWDMTIEVNGKKFKNALKGIDDYLVYKNKGILPHTLTDPKEDAN